MKAIKKDLKSERITEPDKCFEVVEMRQGMKKIQGSGLLDLEPFPTTTL